MFLFLFFKWFGDISDIPNTFPICALEARNVIACMSFGYFMICGPEIVPMGSAVATGHQVVPWIKPLRVRTVGHLSQSFLVPGWKHLNMTGSSRFFLGLHGGEWDTFTHIRWYKKSWFSTTFHQNNRLMVFLVTGARTHRSKFLQTQQTHQPCRLLVVSLSTSDGALAANQKKSEW